MSVLCAQRALENSLTSEIKPTLVQLHDVLILCNQLDDVCTQELHMFDGELCMTTQKLMLQVTLMANELRDAVADNYQ